MSTYEEVADASPNMIDNVIMANGFIKPDQMNFLDMLCNRLDIDVLKFITDFLPNFKQPPQQIPYDEACNLLAILQTYQGEGKDVKEIKEEIKGYSANWQNSSETKGEN